VPLNQRCNQTQEFLLLWSAAGPNEKGADLNVGHLPARRKIGLVPHENPTAIGIDGEQPPIAVGTDVNGSGPNGHAEFYSSCSTLALAHICGEGPLRTEGSAGRALESEPLWGRGSRSNRCGSNNEKAIRELGRMAFRMNCRRLPRFRSPFISPLT
jgi:hypothetical protein